MPRSAQLHNNVGVILKQQGNLPGAVESFTRAVQLDPQAGLMHYNLGNACVELRQLAEAEDCFRRALALVPNDFDVHNNIANVLELQGKWSEAMDHLSTALALRPDYAQSHRNRALLRLMQGDFEAWSEYEWRWQVPDTPQPDYPQPRWHGEPLADRTILLCAEQGLGDVMQFIRYAPLVKKLGARVIVQCHGMLHRLLSKAPGIDRFAAGDGSVEMFDCYAPLMSLPAVFNTRLGTIPRDVPYLFAEPERVERWQRELDGEGTLRIGIAWQGNPGFGGDYYRSIPLERFAPLAACPRVRLYSLQRGHGREQLAAVPASWPIVDLADSLDADGAFVDTAAVIMNLDLVITSDTAIAHLAGALGAPTWVALQYSPNWRWLTERSDNPWYPTMRLFRQQRFGDWEGVFERIAEDVKRMSC